MKRLFTLVATCLAACLLFACQKNQDTQGSGEKKYTVTIPALVKGLKVHECDDSGATIQLLKPELTSADTYEFTANEKATKVKIEVSAQWMDKPSEGVKYRWYKVVTPLKTGTTVNIVVDVNQNQLQEP